MRGENPPEGALSVGVMLLEKLFYLFLEIQKKMRIFFNIFFPFRAFKVFADPHNIFEEFFTKVLGYFFH